MISEYHSICDELVDLRLGVTGDGSVVVGSYEKYSGLQDLLLFDTDFYVLKTIYIKISAW